MEIAWLIPALCVAAFVLLLLWGRSLPGKGAWVTISAVGAGFVLFWFVLGDLLAKGEATFSWPWFQVGGYQLQVGTIVDPLSVAMLGIVTFVALLVQVYSVGYMHGEPRYSWYFAAHSLFAAAMLSLVLADNFIFLYIAWELVGLCSYLLIGFWYDRPAAREAAKKAFVTTRIGDVGLLIGILVLFRETGTFSILDNLAAATGGHIETGTLTVAAILIFLGAMGKSAQFPFHVWLPDAMEGPTPVSALIHAATMVAAGVYLVGRTFPLFQAAPMALQFVFIIGLVTTLLAGTMALVMSDFKRVLAYSTISHLGLMMVALGSGGFAAGIFHLLTHGFSKALVFLGAGSVLHSTGKSEIWDLGGLWRRMPVTAATFVVAALSLAGLPPFSGFWSKDEILKVVQEGQSPIFFALVVVAALLSAMYMLRLLFVVFFGPLKAENAHVHESPGVMTVPLVALGVLSAVFGLVALDPVGQRLGLSGGFGQFLHASEPFHPDWLLMGGSTGLVLLALGVTWTLYIRRSPDPRVLTARLAPLYNLLRHKYFMDDLYQTIIDRVILAFSRLVALFDRTVVNDTGVDGAGHLPVFAGYHLRFHETGKLYNYGLAILVGAIAIVLALAF
ncbi:MAG: NADH-quinone oxidoreductase subunit L [Chloroflexi bacterium]|nr:NADH-quinone oxidoreductase subunit L [Chloroflexota bacterium]